MVVSHSTQHKMEMIFQASPLASSEKTKPKTTKAVIRQELVRYCNAKESKGRFGCLLQHSAWKLRRLCS